MIKAHRQGALDGLCGVYSLINAKRLLFPRMSHAQCVDLFWDCLAWLHERKEFPDFLMNGLSINTMIALSKAVIEISPPTVARMRPFYRKNCSLESFWDDLQKIHSSQKTATVLRLNSGEWKHWSAISNVQKHCFTMLDSIGKKRVFKHHCTLGEIWEGVPYNLLLNSALVYTRSES